MQHAKVCQSLVPSPMPDHAQLMILLWTALFGGAVGSFLNVVIYRLPNGLSLVTPPSHCPKCKNRIRWYDNVPVFGWLLLAGRCRACRCWIPVRYPLIEAFTAAMFAAVAAVEMHALATVYPVHVLLLCTLLCAALIEYDGHRPPWTLFLPAILAGVAAQFFWPSLVLPSPTSRLLTLLPCGVPAWSLLALGGAILLGELGWRPVFGLALLAVLLGLGSIAFVPIALAVLVIQGVSWLLRGVWPKKPMPPFAALGVITLAWILLVAWIGA